MTQIDVLYSHFPSDRSARRRLHDQLHASLSSAGVSPDVLAIVGDSSRIVELQRHLREELLRVTSLHHSNSGANVRLEFDSDGNISVKKGVASSSILPVTELPSGWLEDLRRGYECASSAANTSGISPSPTATIFATAERPSGAANDSYCPFSTPPEFRGFDASPLAAADDCDIGSPNVLD